MFKDVRPAKTALEKPRSEGHATVADSFEACR